MDRGLARGPIGLACSWLECSEASKENHDLQKLILSSQESRSVRAKARQSFSDLAEQHGGIYRLFMDVEFEFCGSREEPASIPCPPVARGFG